MFYVSMQYLLFECQATLSLYSYTTGMNPNYFGLLSLSAYWKSKRILLYKTFGSINHAENKGINKMELGNILCSMFP